MQLKIIIFILLFVFISCSGTNNGKNESNQQSVDNKVEQNSVIIEDNPQHSSKFISKFTEEANKIISANKFVSFSELQQQKLKNIEENSNVTVSWAKPKKMSGNELYFYLKESSAFLFMLVLIR